MARTDLAAVATSRAGVDLTAGLTAATVDGHAFADNGRMLLVVKNTDTTAKQVTFDIPVLVDGMTVTDRQVSVPANTGLMLYGPFTPVYRQANGKVHIDYSAVTGLSVKLLEVPAS
ncbi:hypothetical protein ABZ470_39485 [Streptosporangium sp. NPDC020072]|uniref:hypothetical protein n=1 Tax=Streptosporangium sp. NPDC020072 TaxID=3154788 RepID=UPI00343F880E